MASILKPYSKLGAPIYSEMIGPGNQVVQKVLVGYESTYPKEPVFTVKGNDLLTEDGTPVTPAQAVAMLKSYAEECASFNNGPKVTELSATTANEKNELFVKSLVDILKEDPSEFIHPSVLANLVMGVDPGKPGSDKTGYQFTKSGATVGIKINGEVQPVDDYHSGSTLDMEKKKNPWHVLATVAQTANQLKEMVEVCMEGNEAQPWDQRTSNIRWTHPDLETFYYPKDKITKYRCLHCKYTWSMTDEYKEDMYPGEFKDYLDNLDILS